ncbi:MAG: ZIP family metal transporter [Steroidobacterales bacterium]
MLFLTISIAAFCATFAGGLFALRLQDKLHLVLGFSAGAVIAVAFFDLLPEAIALGAPRHDVTMLLACSAIGFLGYLVLDRIRWLRVKLGHGAGSLSAHSFLDGVAIGLAFQASRPAGMVVTVAVLIHDFSDGINTASLVLKNGGDRNRTLRWLWADALAPGLGIGSTLFYAVPPAELGLVLALFSGFFLYIGASDLIPESFHAHPKFLTTFMTLIGAAVLYLAIAWAGR